MATAKKAAKKAAGEWTSETLKEWKVTESVTWKAQKSTSPEGDEFIGVRQYIKTKTKGEIAGKGGITFKLDENAKANVTKIRGLFEELSKTLLQGDVQKTTAKKPATTRRKKDEEPEEESSDQYVLMRPAEGGGFEFLSRARTVDDVVKVRVTAKRKEAQLFTGERADDLLGRLSKKWKKQEL